MVEQMSLDDFLKREPEFIPELICCPLSQGFYWLRITSGYTPARFLKYIDFNLDGYDYLYKGSSLKDEIISMFIGTVKHIHYNSQE